MNILKIYGLPGVGASPYTAKVRSFLTTHGFDFEELESCLLLSKLVLEKKVGRWIIPVVLTPEGRFSQGSQVIISKLSKDYQSDPKIKTLEALFDLFGDEWLVIPALHYRWSYKENRKFILNNFGNGLMPGWPKFFSL